MTAHTTGLLVAVIAVFSSCAPAEEAPPEVLTIEQHVAAAPVASGEEHGALLDLLCTRATAQPPTPAPAAQTRPATPRAPGPPPRS